jgi:hypothetical protein
VEEEVLKFATNMVGKSSFLSLQAELNKRNMILQRPSQAATTKEQESGTKTEPTKVCTERQHIQ